MLIASWGKDYVSSSSLVSFPSWWLNWRFSMLVACLTDFINIFSVYIWNDRNDDILNLLLTIWKKIIFDGCFMSYLSWPAYYYYKRICKINMDSGIGHIDNILGYRNGLSINLLLFGRSCSRTIKSTIR